MIYRYLLYCAYAFGVLSGLGMFASWDSPREDTTFGKYFWMMVACIIYVLVYNKVI
jgi:hypothetical protein